MVDAITSSKNLSVRKQLQDWFSSESGTLLLQEESEKLAQRLNALFGYHILQIGDIGGTDFLGSSRILHKMIARLVPGEQGGHRSDFCCDCTNLPVASGSIDVVVLPHVLEFEANPHQVLR